MAGTATLPGQAGSAVSTPTSGKTVVFVDTDTDALGLVAVKRSDGSVVITGTGTVTSVTGTAPISSTGGTTPAISIVAATDSVPGSMSAADKTKLDGMTAGAAVASVGATAPITSSGGTAPTIAINAATDSTAGSMSAADKTKLDGITAGAAVASVGATAPITSTGGTSPTIAINAATDSTAGSMSAADKTKLDGIAAGAAVSAVTGTAPIVSSGGDTPAISITPASLTTAGSEAIATVQKQRLFIDLIADYGAKFDHRQTGDGATTGPSGIITSATIAFVAGDVGKRITLGGAGASGAMYVGTITSLNSGTSVNVTPNTTTTVSAKGLQVHTDDLTAWTNMITDINASVYPGAVVKIEAPMVTTLTSGETWQATPFTGRSGISAALPTINKQITIIGYGGGMQSDTGNYALVGGSCLSYAGASLWTGFGAVMSIAPVAGATNQAIMAPRFQSFWIDCNNGGSLGYNGLKGLQMFSCHGWIIDDFFVNDPGAVGIEFGVISPGTAGALGEAKDCTRGHLSNYRCRAVDTPTGGVTTPFAMTSAVTLSTTGQSLTVAANSLPTAGYIWVETNAGYPVLVQYTGGGGTTTLTGCVISPNDNIDTPATVNGSFVVQAVPGNACSIMFAGDLTANTCLNMYDTVIIEQGSTWGPAALEFRNSDSNELHNVVVNGGSATVVSAINRITRPGVRFNGSNSNFAMSARNNTIFGGSPGAGGCSVMSLTSAGALLLSPAVANYWELQQLANGEPLPVVESLTTSGTQGAAGSYFGFGVNGGFQIGVTGPVFATVAGQSIAAATTALLSGCTVPVPPQGWQVGLTLRWHVPMSKTAAGVAARTVSIHYGSTGSTSDGVIATTTVTPSSTATADQGKMILEMVCTALGSGTSGAAATQLTMLHNALPSATTGGLSNVGTNQITMTPTGFNTTLPAGANAYITVAITTGAAEVLTILPPCYCECIWPGNPIA